MRALVMSWFLRNCSWTPPRYWETMQGVLRSQGGSRMSVSRVAYCVCGVISWNSSTHAALVGSGAGGACRRASSTLATSWGLRSSKHFMPFMKRMEPLSMTECRSRPLSRSNTAPSWIRNADAPTDQHRLCARSSSSVPNRPPSELNVLDEPSDCASTVRMASSPLSPLSPSEGDGSKKSCWAGEAREP